MSEMEKEEDKELEVEAAGSEETDLFCIFYVHFSQGGKHSNKQVYIYSNFVKLSTYHMSPHYRRGQQSV